ncbi:addiction module protein [Flavobacterium album]|uniref:Addiction module protein n=1 Tax=Flavobacterium album TaxID=2175091 RepID=A0A2S1QVA4_9FLAO|nr:addiction module protein [Flavobacterium album]AWH84151.1 addiction module protein [Flavobacterium album]
MKVKDIEKYSNAEKIILAEQLWDSISKKDLELSDEIKQELDIRLDRLERGETQLYTWDEVKSRIKGLRK